MPDISLSFGKSLYFSSFGVLHCDTRSKIHNSPLFNYGSSWPQIASTAPCFNIRFLTRWSIKHDRSLHYLPSAFNSSISFLILSLAHPLLRLFFHHHLCFQSFCHAFAPSCASFCSLPPQVTSSANLLSSFSVLPQFIVRKLQGVPRHGDGEGFLRF